jgi:hypothetical protein
MGGDASTLFVDIGMSIMDNTSSMSIKRRHCVNNIGNVGNCNNVRLCMKSCHLKIFLDCHKLNKFVLYYYKK